MNDANKALDPVWIRVGDALHYAEWWEKQDDGSLVFIALSPSYPKGWGGVHAYPGCWEIIAL